MPTIKFSTDKKPFEDIIFHGDVSLDTKEPVTFSITMKLIKHEGQGEAEETTSVPAVYILPRNCNLIQLKREIYLTMASKLEGLAERAPDYFANRVNAPAIIAHQIMRDTFFNNAITFLE